MFQTDSIEACARCLTVGAAALIGCATYAPTLQAQDPETRFPGARLGLIYEGGGLRPAVAIQPFGARFGGDRVVGSVEGILGRDLRYSDRYEVLDSLPESLEAEGVDYSLWDRLGATFLVTGQVEGSGTEFELAVEVHDVVYAQVRNRGRFRIPAPEDDEYRMAVHRVSDQVVEWISGEPGMAASRIAFTRPSQDGSKEIWVIDSDGENMRRITNHRSITVSPAWSPTADRLSFVSFREGNARVYIHDLATGQERQVDPGRAGQHYTPAFNPNGRELTFTIADRGRSGLYSWNLRDDCCLTRLTEGRWDDLSPTYSPDGRWVAFMSNRLSGTAAPKIHVMPAFGGQPDLLSPFDGYYTSPDWSPFGDRVAFHGRLRRGRYQILVAEMGDGGRRLLQLTSEGNNEDPSWAPDGRHLVFVGERRNGFGLMIVDAATGRIRTILPSVRAGVPQWSPALAEGAGGPLRSGDD